MNSGTTQKSCWTEYDAIAVVLFGIFLVFGNLIARLSDTFSNEPKPLTSGHLVAMLIPTAFAIALTAKRCAESRCSLKKLFGITDIPREVLRGLFLGLAFVPLAVILSTFTAWVITTITGEPPAPQALMHALMHEETPRAVAYATFINATTLVPLTEEILYRGILITVIKRSRSTAFTIIASSFFFSLLHLSPVHIPSLIIMGAGFAYVYLASGSLLTSIAMHAAFNAANLLLVFVR